MTLEPLIQIEHLKKTFPSKGLAVKAIDDVSLTIYAGETLGLVGESGSGKSTLGRLLLKLEEACEGHIYFMKKDITRLTFRSLQPLRPKMQMIFQDPYASLNPRMTIGDIIAEPYDIYGIDIGISRKEKIDQLLRLVGLDTSFQSRFPHELSGGQRQRVGIARALCLDPRFIVCDEPISALDVSVQAQIVNLLKTLQKEKNLTLLFIAHDLSMVKYISTRVAVMYLGKIVELAPTEELYKNPLHPYTEALLSAQPIPDPRLERERKKILLQGEISTPSVPLKGCIFASRCPHASQTCKEIKPKWKEIHPGHYSACHVYD